MDSKTKIQKKTQRVRKSRDFKAIQEQLGTSVRLLREEHGMTQQVAADKSGINVRHWQKLEAGEINVSLITLYRVAELFKVEIAEIV